MRVDGVIASESLEIICVSVAFLGVLGIGTREFMSMSIVGSIFCR
jgi:hypothetical protein